MNEREIFTAALQQPTDVDRKKFLDELDDDALRQRVEELLNERSRMGSFLEHSPVQLKVSTSPPGDESHAEPAEETADKDPDSTMSDRNRSPKAEGLLGFLQPTDSSDALGRLGHYEILEVIGSGAFGTVFRAFDTALDRVVAIKMMAPELATTSPARKRFLREARSSAQIRHENVVAVYGVENEPIPYLVMEYIPGRTLQDHLNETGPLEVSVVLRMGKQIADGLAAAHAEGLIHRDIKPGNILLETNAGDRVKISDFGLARTVDDASLTQSGMIAGTPLYMAPEQALGARLDTRADLFSLGSVLYQMVSGRPPFRAPNTVAVLKRVAEETPRPIREIIPETPDWMCNLISRLHAKDPDDRWQTAKDVSDVLANCLSDLEKGQKPQFPVPPIEDDSEDAEGEEIDTIPRRSFWRSRWGKVAAVFALLTVGLGITEGTGVTRIASTVVRIAVGSGTLIIESDDPGLKIRIDGEDITIRGGGVEELTLKPGQYTVTATKDGQPVKKELVTITRNGREVFNVSLVSSKSGPKTVNRKTPGTPPVRWGKNAPQLAVAPFNMKQARQFQRAWAKYLGVPMEREIVLGKDKAGEEVKLELVLIPPGEFQMGASKKERTRFLEQYAVPNKDKWAAGRIPSEGPVHRVRITRPFYVAKYETTQAQWKLVTGGNPSKFNDDESKPVEQVNWNDIQPFLARLNKTTDAVTFQLPTEAQWEYACRAGTTTIWHTGDSEAGLRESGWFHKNAGGKTHPIGRLKPNAFGLYDIAGNVWEWCADRFSADFYASGIVDDPTGAIKGTERAIRGGCSMFHANYCRSASREHNVPSHTFKGLGFRVAAAIPDAVFRGKTASGGVSAQSKKE